MNQKELNKLSCAVRNLKVSSEHLSITARGLYGHSLIILDYLNELSPKLEKLEKYK